jgi:hypothetical protein
VFSAPARKYRSGIGVGLGELPVDRDGLLGGSQRLLVSTQIRQGELDCVQRDREDGQVVGVGVRLGELPVDRDGFLGRGQRLLVST